MIWRTLDENINYEVSNTGVVRNKNTKKTSVYIHKKII